MKNVLDEGAKVSRAHEFDAGLDLHTPAKDYKFKAGEKIAQLVIVPCLLPELELADHLEETDRGDGGFGSTGR